MKAGAAVSRFNGRSNWRGVFEFNSFNVEQIFQVFSQNCRTASFVFRIFKIKLQYSSLKFAKKQRKNIKNNNKAKQKKKNIKR